MVIIRHYDFIHIRILLSVWKLLYMSPHPFLIQCPACPRAFSPFPSYSRVHSCIHFFPSDQSRRFHLLFLSEVHSVWKLYCLSPVLNLSAYGHCSALPASLC